MQYKPLGLTLARRIAGLSKKQASNKIYYIFHPESYLTEPYNVFGKSIREVLLQSNNSPKKSNL